MVLGKIIFACVYKNRTQLHAESHSMHWAPADAKYKTEIDVLLERKVHPLEDRIQIMVWCGCVQLTWATHARACAHAYDQKVLRAARPQTGLCNRGN